MVPGPPEDVGAPYAIAVINLDVPLLKEISLTAWDLARVFRAFNPAISIADLGAGTKAHMGARPESQYPLPATPPLPAGRGSAESATIHAAPFT